MYTCPIVYSNVDHQKLLWYSIQQYLFYYYMKYTRIWVDLVSCNLNSLQCIKSAVNLLSALQWHMSWQLPYNEIISRVASPRAKLPWCCLKSDGVCSFSCMIANIRLVEVSVMIAASKCVNYINCCNGHVTVIDARPPHCLCDVLY